eukprot:TRINITY_DN115_c0_g2_i1.p1 TRINITY_DN115_c0_g2~~TRINITY_DN115_c0_g2_i1.p1  ORF type:complete len:657 (+),score=288.38 TRINITY_DN115_c0_g2_i1:139-2109(+)
MAEDAAEQTRQLFLSLGLDAKRAADTVKNEKLTELLKEFAIQGGVEKGADKAIGNALYNAAVKFPANATRHVGFLAKYITGQKLPLPQQIPAALSYLKMVGDADIEVKSFEKETGVGVVVTEQQIADNVDAVLKAKSEDLSKDGWSVPIGPLIQMLKDRLPWADAAAVKAKLDEKMLALLGPKVAKEKAKKEDAPAAAKEPKKEKAKVEAVALAAEELKAFKPIKTRQIPQFEGVKVRVCGWVHSFREAIPGKLWFVDIRDGTGFAQSLLAEGLSSVAESLTRETSVMVYGTLQKPPGKNFAPGGLELHAAHVAIVGESPLELENVINPESSVDLLLDQRHLVLRGKHASSVMKLRSLAAYCFRQYYYEQGYQEATPPTLVQTQCEGGGELFSFDYFGEPAYLTQSSQLYLETVIPSMGDVFCMTSSYRAEKSRTRRHLAEYTHIEAERPFITFDDLLDSIEDLVCSVIQKMLEIDSALVLSVNPKAAVPKRPFRRMAYVEALEYCREHNIYKDANEKTNFEFGDDIPEGPERIMIEQLGEPVLLTRFPVTLKAFYMPKCDDDPRVTESCDLLLPGVGEIVGGSMRIWKFDELMAAYKREGIDPEPYYWFTDQRKYGSVPHGGYGLGFERFLTWISGDDHIRNMCMYPRYRDRCRP